MVRHSDQQVLIVNQFTPRISQGWGEIFLTPSYTYWSSVNREIL